MNGLSEQARAKNRYTRAQAEAAAAESKRRSAEATRARFQEEDEDGDECWLHCPVACFLSWLDAGRCPHAPQPEPEPVEHRRSGASKGPAVPRPPGATYYQHMIAALRGQPPLTSQELAERMGIDRGRVTSILSSYRGTYFEHAGVATGKGRRMTWRLVQGV